MTFWRAHREREKIGAAPCRAWLVGASPGTAVVVEAGLGRAAMDSAIRWVLEEFCPGGVRYRPTFLLLAGFSGALERGRAIGELVLATQVLDEHGRHWPATWPPGERPILQQGRVLTSDALVSDAARKLQLGARHGAQVVDMESAVAADLCHRFGVPFACLRAISDDVDTPLSPQLVDLLQAGQPSWPALLAALLRRPSLALELWTLARNTRIASGQLAPGIQQVLAAVADSRASGAG